MVAPPCDGEGVIPEFDQCYRAVRGQGRPLRRVVLHRRADDRASTAGRAAPPARRTARTSSFYPTAAAAQGAGYRACKRCRPDASPGSPEWDPRGDVVARAMRLIADGVVDREGVPGLAAPARRTATASCTVCSSPSSAPGRSRSPGRSGRRRPGCSSRRPTSASPTSRSRPGSRASASSTTRSARCSRSTPSAMRTRGGPRGRARQHHGATPGADAVRGRRGARVPRRRGPSPGSRSGGRRHATDGRSPSPRHTAARAHARPDAVTGDVPPRRPAGPHGRGARGAAGCFDLDADPVAVDAALAARIPSCGRSCGDGPGSRVPGTSRRLRARRAGRGRPAGLGRRRPARSSAAS